VAKAACKHGLTVAEIEDWQERLLLAAENACASFSRAPDSGGQSAAPAAGLQIAEIKPLFRGGAEVYRTPELGRSPRPYVR